MGRRIEIPERGGLDLKYLDRSTEQSVKDYFEFVVSAARNALNISRPLKILDVGCATGSFLVMLQRLYPQHHYTGVDIAPELTARAASLLPEAAFITGDLCSALASEERNFDMIFANAMHSMFDDLKLFLASVTRALAKNGAAWIFGPFNPEPLDVIASVRGRGLPEAGIKGWNLFSLETAAQLSSELGFAPEVLRYSPPRKDRTSADPFVSWVIDAGDYGPVLLNGVQLLQHMYLLKLTLKE